MRQGIGAAFFLSIAAMACESKAVFFDGGRDAALDAHADARVDGAFDASPDSALDANLVRPAHAARLHDVSILFPLTSGAAPSAYLHASDETERGLLLPRELYREVVGNHEDSTACHPDPNLPTSGGNECLPWNEMAVVAMRIDPCFGALDPEAEDAICRNQVRLILQRLNREDQTLFTSDGAVHAFYELSRTELTELASAVVNLRLLEQNNLDDFSRLAVHPVLRRQGVGGAFGNELAQLIRRYAGSANLVKVTSMETDGSRFWSFRGIDIAQGITTVIDIPTVERTGSQNFGLPVEQVLEGSVFPNGTHADSVELLVNQRSLNEASTAQKNSAVAASFRLENPRLHIPDDTDCVSCHIAQIGREYSIHNGFVAVSGNDADRFRPDLNFVSESETRALSVRDFFPDLPSEEQDLQTLRNLHAFSYRGMVAYANQRVVNESADVVSYLNRFVLRSSTP